MSAYNVTDREWEQMLARIATLEVQVAELVKPKKLPRKTRLREDWEPSEHAKQHSRENYSYLNLRSELDQFKNHHISRGTTMVDWDRAWYTWLGNVRRFAPPSARTNDDKIRELMEMSVDAEGK